MTEKIFSIPILSLYLKNSHYRFVFIKIKGIWFYREGAKWNKYKIYPETSTNNEILYL